ncbi:hypothetical protein AGMMS4956_07060 [Bacteroidia bacterium]|nr:hypothetical protein AGMMS4956_07060 [Bacteroidia bacterium]
MKILKFFLLFCALHFTTIVANAQTITLSGNSISVKQLITEIEKQTDGGNNSNPDAAPHTFVAPSGLTIDGNGNFYIAQQYHHEDRIFDH